MPMRNSLGSGVPSILSRRSDFSRGLGSFWERTAIPAPDQKVLKRRDSEVWMEKKALDDPHHPVLKREEVRVPIARVIVNPLS